MSLTIASAEVAEGVRLPYAEHGDPGGHPLVFLHGITDSHRTAQPFLERLPDWIHAYALTQRGHGDASRPGSYELDDLAGDVAGFLDAAGHASAVIVGHSMGSAVATRFAMLHPGRTDALVIMGGATTFSRVGLEGMAAEVAGLSDPLDEAYLREFQLSTLARPVPAAFVDLSVRESAKLSAATFRALLHDTLLRDHSDALGSITAPTLVAWGDRDTVSPRSEQDALVAAIPDARLSVHEGAGHAFHWEDPDRFARELAAFVEEVRA